MTTGEAQGVYFGTYSYGGSFYAVVLPSDMFYAFDAGIDIGPNGVMSEPWVLRTGQGSSASGTYTANLTHYVWGTTLQTVLAATYVRGTNLSGNVQFVHTGATHSFSALALPATRSDFTRPANLADIAGTWKGAGLCDPMGEPCEPLTATISSNGEFKMSPNPGCTFATVTPDESRNYFHVNLAAGPGACFSSGNLSGFAVVMLLPDGVGRQLLFAAGDHVLVAQR